jgi:hypothetical protein
MTHYEMFTNFRRDTFEPRHEKAVHMPSRIYPRYPTEQDAQLNKNMEVARASVEPSRVQRPE